PCNESASASGPRPGSWERAGRRDRGAVVPRGAGLAYCAVLARHRVGLLLRPRPPRRCGTLRHAGVPSVRRRRAAWPVITSSWNRAPRCGWVPVVDASEGEEGAEMKSRVERDVLADAVTGTARTLPTRPPVPVLAGVRLEAEAG